MIRACLLAAVLGALAALTPQSAPAQAQINRCTAPDGTSIYTDRECSALGAVDRLPSDRSDTGGGSAKSRLPAYRGGCARSIHQLIQQMTVAIDAGDVNRLAALYHWPGTSYSHGQRLMNQLERVARTPVVDIVAERAASPVVAAQERGISSTFASTLQTSASTRSAAPATRSPPVALRVHQSSGTGAAPSRTRFALRQHLGCWWVSL